MREIKFRAWVVDAKKMLPPQTLSELLDGEYECGFNLSVAGIHATTADMIWLQYTGLKDRKGDEIYDGDVCRFDAVMWKIYFIDACFWAQSDTREMELYQIHPHEIEIIGNIYENPELLSGRKAKGEG